MCHHSSITFGIANAYMGSVNYLIILLLWSLNTGLGFVFVIRFNGEVKKKLI